MECILSHANGIVPKINYTVMVVINKDNEKNTITRNIDDKQRQYLLSIL